MDDARCRRQVLLQMKARAGLLTDEERKELRSTPIFVGGEEPGSGALVVYPPMTEEEWVAEFGGVRRPVENEAQPPPEEPAGPLPPLNPGPGNEPGSVRIERP